jgi:hypothetical protein
MCKLTLPRVQFIEAVEASVGVSEGGYFTEADNCRLFAKLVVRPEGGGWLGVLSPEGISVFDGCRVVATLPAPQRGPVQCCQHQTRAAGLIASTDQN